MGLHFISKLEYVDHMMNHVIYNCISISDIFWVLFFTLLVLQPVKIFGSPELWPNNLWFPFGYKLILESHVILYVFWLVKKVEVICQWMESKNRRRSQSVVCRCHQVIFFKWGTFGVIKIFSDYLPYFEKINIFLNIITKKVWINL